MFSRPRSLFWPYSNSGESPLFGSVVGGVPRHSTSATDDWPVEVESESELRQRLICTNGDGKCCLHTPDGLVQLAPEAVRKMTKDYNSKMETFDLRIHVSDQFGPQNPKTEKPRVAETCREILS